MINKWILNNFKSIDKEKELHFRSLTIFTGANSSGKSTILQSILLVTQTLQDQIESRSIVLNGWFKKFGTYSDIVFHREDSRNIKIGFEIQDEQTYHTDYTRMITMGQDGEKTYCHLVFSSDGGKKDMLLPVLEDLCIETYGPDDKKTSELCVQHHPIRKVDEMEVIEQGRQKYGENYFDYGISLTGYVPQFSFRREQMGTPIGCNLSHFLPENIVHYTSYREYMKEKLMYLLMYDHDWKYELEEQERLSLRPLLKDKAMEILWELRGKKKMEFLNEEKFSKRMENLDKKFTLQKFDALFRRSTLSIEERREYINALLQKLYGLPDKYLFDRESLEYTHKGISTVKYFFSNRIKYLGPLREEPKSFYQLDTSSTPMELGLKGENTAAVFENNKRRTVRYVDPSYFENGAMGEPKLMTGKLSDAVFKWMTYLGVASRVNTYDRGMIGHALKITNELGDMQDLTHVGVGVSQVLPILVMAFLANKGDVIILEQPELHLHPKVQTRLADFFVTMTQLGKQCLIETHSEYFINRLRYRVAVSDSNRIADDTMIYFVEKDKKEGYSKYREVTINKYGVIEDWPEGFFDEGERIAAEILRAGMNKKMKEEEYEE